MLAGPHEPLFIAFIDLLHWLCFILAIPPVCSAILAIKAAAAVFPQSYPAYHSDSTAADRKLPSLISSIHHVGPEYESWMRTRFRRNRVRATAQGTASAASTNNNNTTTASAGANTTTPTRQYDDLTLRLQMHCLRKGLPEVDDLVRSMAAATRALQLAAEPATSANNDKEEFAVATRGRKSDVEFLV